MEEFNVLVINDAFTIVLALLMISMIINLYLTLKVKSLNEQLKVVGSNICVTQEELRAIRQRLEAMKGKM
jgi:hypothetical protein